MRQLVETSRGLGDQVGWCDPVEPDYDGWHKTGSVYPARGMGFSFAHGLRVRFLLGTKADRVELRQARFAQVLARAEAVLTRIEKASTTLDEETVEALAAFAKADERAAVERIEAAAKAKGEGRSRGEKTELQARVKAYIRQAQAEESDAAMHWPAPIGWSGFILSS